MIESKKEELRDKKKEIIKKENQANDLNTKINMYEQALVVLEKNKIEKKLKLKKKMEKKKINISKEELSPDKNYNSNQNYTKTLPSNNNKAEINKININNPNNNNVLNKQTNYYLKSQGSISSNKNNIIYAYTEEEKNKAISVFTEEEKNIIMKMVNKKKGRYNTLIEKLIVLQRFRNTKKKQLKVRQRQNNNKYLKNIENLETLKEKEKGLEIQKKEILKEINELNNKNTEIKKRINLINKELKDNKELNKNVNENKN